MQSVLQRDYPKLHAHPRTHKHLHTGIYKFALGIKHQFAYLLVCTLTRKHVHLYTSKTQNQHSNSTFFQFPLVD